jgi:hypothetical protein
VQGIPDEVERLILKALEKPSSRRHLTLRQLLGEMDAALAHLPASMPVALPQAPRPSPPARRSGSVPSQRQTSSKTIVGIGLKDLLPHLAPPPAQAAAPTPKPQAVIVPEPPPPELPVAPPAIAQPIAPAAPPPGRATKPIEAPAVTFSKPASAPPPAEPSGRQGRFRETMWFKKGEAEEEGDEAQASGDLPIEDRYKDDGTITAADRERLSLRAGSSMAAQPRAARPVIPGDRMDEEDMIGELRGGRTRMLVILAAAAVVIVLVVVYFAAIR